MKTNQNLHRWVKRIGFLLVSLLLLSLVQCAYYNTLFNAKRSFEEGIKVIQKNPVQEKIPAKAKKYFQATADKSWKLLEIYGENSKYADDALLYICKSEFYLEKYLQAKTHLEQFMSKYRDSELLPEAYLWYGKTLFKLKEYDTAKEYLNMAITTAKDKSIRSQANFELGKFAYENEDFEDAIRYFLNALDEKPNDQYKALIQFYLGEAYYIQKDYTNAIKQYKKVSKFSPTVDIEYQTRFHLAKSYVATQKHKDALEILRKMLTAPRFKNFFSIIRTTIAEIYEKEERYEEAIDTYKEILRAKKSDAGTAQAALNLAHLFETVYQDVDSAVFYYGRVKKIYSRYDSVKYAENKKVFLRELKDIRDAIKRDRRLIYLIENDAYFRDSLYQAQYEDSIRRVLGDTLDYANQTDDLQRQLNLRDSLDQKDSLRQLQNQQDSLENQQNTPFDFLTREDPDLQSQKPKNQQTNQKGAKNKQQKPPPVKKKKKRVERRKLPQIKEDLKNNQFHLAEYFLLKVENYDSAAFHYQQFLETYQDSILTPKALYSLYYIYSRPDYSQPELADSIKEKLLLEYPNSIFARQLKSGKVQVVRQEEKKDSLESMAHKQFLDAEALYFSGQIDSALRVYRKVAGLDSNLIWSAKAQLAIAWIYEHEKEDYPAAILAYQTLERKFSNFPEFVRIAKKKTAKPRTAEDELLLAKKNQAESEVSASTENGFGSRTSNLTAPGKPANFQKKVQWRMNRNKRVFQQQLNQ